MMNKNLRPLYFFYSFILTFIVLILTLYTYFYAKQQTNWILELLRTRMFRIPLIIYVILIALVVSGIFMGLLYFIDMRTYGKIEKQLRLMALGHYDHYELNKKSQVSTPSSIEIDIQLIRKKVLAMSKELQELSKHPKLVEGESKEELIKEERHRIARELHDSVSQQLFAATMMLSTLNEVVAEIEVPEVVSRQMLMISDIINTAQSEMRALLLHLRPINLEEKTIKQGIELLLNELQTKINIKIVWDLEDIKTQTAIEDNLFRIVQELLSNTLRHAKAEVLEVFLKTMDQNILLRIVDDGVGFDMDQEKIGSYGLNNIKERVISMGGTCRIISFKDQGTSIEIKVPILEEAE